MINDFDRATRTLIVSFVIAIMALIPLRFVEIGQSLNLAGSQVLGDYNQVVLPQDYVVSEEAMLEAPYNEIESVNVETEEVSAENEACIELSDAEILINDLGQRLMDESLTSEQIDQVIVEMEAIDNNTCR